MTDLRIFRQQLLGSHHQLAETLRFIDVGYHYQPSAFSVGSLRNAAGQNERSCKLLGLAKLEHLTMQETLLAFGEHYRRVLATPEATDHGNIRALMAVGLDQVHFQSLPLTRRG